jgi:hypothetical protein
MEAFGRDAARIAHSVGIDPPVVTFAHGLVVAFATGEVDILQFWSRLLTTEAFARIVGRFLCIPRCREHALRVCCHDRNKNKIIATMVDDVWRVAMNETANSVLSLATLSALGRYGMSSRTWLCSVCDGVFFAAGRSQSRLAWCTAKTEIRVV